MSKTNEKPDKYYKLDAIVTTRRWNYGLVRGRTLKAGQTRWPSRTIDYDRDLIGYDHDTRTVFPSKNENNYVSTSYRVGPVHARGSSSACTSCPNSGNYNNFYNWINTYHYS